MRYETLRSQVRAARKQRALSQAALASQSGVSRVTIARFESGADQDFRFGAISRVCAALGLDLVAVASGTQAAHETSLARTREQVRRLDRRGRHAALAVRLLVEPASEAAAKLEGARANVARWERERLCSAHYITRWRRMLSGPVERVAQSLLRDDAWADALFQSSPFAFALERPAA
jgi:transcriptional regulator with XRE-family HTH domain